MQIYLTRNWSQCFQVFLECEEGGIWEKGGDWGRKKDVGPNAYLIFVTNAANAVRVNFLAECKKISRKTRKLLFWAPFITQQ